MARWIIVRDGAYRYFRKGPGSCNWSQQQRDAMRFDSREAAKQEMWKWQSCYGSSWPPRVCRLVPNPFREMRALIESNAKRIEQIDETLRRLAVAFRDRNLRR